MDAVSLPAWLVPIWGGVSAVAAVTLGLFLRRHPFSGGSVRPLDLGALDLLAFLCFLVAGALFLGGFWFSGLALAGVLLMWGHHEGAPGIRARLGWRGTPLAPLAALGLGLWITAVVGLPLQLFSSALGTLFEHLHWKTPLEPAVALFLDAHHPLEMAEVLGAALLLAPAAEEVFFRGFLQPAFKARFGMRSAAVLSALAFAAMHAHALTFLPLVAMGLILALAYEWSGSLLLCIAVHFWFNLSTVLVLLSGHSNL